MPDGYLKLGTGQGSCYKLRAALRIFPDHLPLVAYNSCSTLSATKMAELTKFFKHADCPFLETFQASFNGSQAAPVQPPGPSRCVLRVGGWEGGFFCRFAGLSMRWQHCSAAIRVWCLQGIAAPGAGSLAGDRCSHVLCGPGVRGADR